MRNIFFIFAAALWAGAYAVISETNTPVPILKQINSQNDDGSYSYGYESGDGSYKIETKYPSGEVRGKYGYVDSTGNVREIEYSANPGRGFEPSGPGITVPPVTIAKNASPNDNYLPEGVEDDGQYREDPSIYYKSDQPSQPLTKKLFQKFDNRENSEKQFYTPPRQAPIVQAAYQQQYRNSDPYTSYDRPAYRPAPAAPYVAGGHPAASNIDLYSGSYRISYTGR